MMLLLYLPVALFSPLLLQETPTVQHHPLQDLLHLHQSQQYLLTVPPGQTVRWKEAPATQGTVCKGARSAATSAVRSQRRSAPAQGSRLVQLSLSRNVRHSTRQFMRRSAVVGEPQCAPLSMSRFVQLSMSKSVRQLQNSSAAHPTPPPHKKNVRPKWSKSVRQST